MQRFTPTLRFLVPLFFFFFTGLSLIAQSSNWTSHGPDGGNINAITISASDPRIIYAGTDHGIFKTENGGEFWFKTSFPDLYEVTSIKVHRTDPDIVLAGTYRCGIYKSENGGESWKYMGLWYQTINTIATDPNNPDVVYFGTGESMANPAEEYITIYKASGNWVNGTLLEFWNNWDECGWSQVNKIVVDPDSSNWIYAAGINSGYCSDFGSVLVSQDGGESWTNKKIGTTNSDAASNIAVVINSLGERTLVAIFNGSPIISETKLMKSSNMGDSWDEVVPPYAGNINPNILMVHPRDPGTVIIGSTDVGKPLWLYTEETGTWDFIAGSGLPPVISSPCTELDEGEESACYLATMYGGIYRSEGNEGRWEQINAGINNSVVNDFAVDPENSSIVYAATEEALKLYKSTDAGKTWEIQPSNLSTSFDLLELDPNHPSTFWAAKNSSGSGGYKLFKGENFGQSWAGPIDFVNGTPASNRTEISDILVKPGDSDMVLVSAQPWFLSTGLTGFGVVALTANGGSQWNNFPVAGSCLAADPADPDMIYVGKERAGQVFLIEIDGASVTISTIDPEEGLENVQDIEVDNRSNLFVATEDGLWRKDAAGWTKLDCPEPNITSLAMDHSTNPSVVYAGSDAGGILVSGDGGENWMPINDGLGNLNIRKVQICNHMLYASTSFGGVWSRNIPQNLAPPFLTHQTGNMEISVFQNGSIGHAAPNWNYGDGLIYKGNPVDPLFGGGLVLGTTGSGRVNGQLGSFGINNDFQTIIPIKGFESVPGKWDQVTTSIFNDETSPSPLGIRVVQRSYSNDGEDLLILRYVMEPLSGPIQDLYAGLYADWDIGGGDHHDRNLGGFDPARNLAYQYLDGGDPDPYYYGFVALEGMSGTRITGKGSSLYIRDSSFRWISTVNDTAITEPQELRMWIGSGPFTLGENESLQVCFAVVTGSSLDELQANADLAAQRALSLQDPTSSEVKQHLEFSLGQNQPNPFQGETELQYTVPYACDVLIELYDARGVVVRSILEKDRPAGYHSLRITDEGLDPGIYFYSLKAAGFCQTKMMVLTQH
jgi:photosystem II stability/assembly factor-like uncharacterized protein